MEAFDVGRSGVVTGRELVQSLRRWQDFGAVWRVLRREGGEVTIGLFRCDGGEEVHRFISDDEDLVAFVSGRPTQPG